MRHLGDICKINGAEIEPVDVITGGSPCQDLSIAGKRVGLAGARSGLFMEQIRVVKEMREHDRRMGRTGEFIRPRYMVWENVPGAFSSNKGRDFAAVLEEIIRIVKPEAPSIEVPEKGWPTWGGYHDEMGGRWSVAWRVHDAQYWGVPQRRRRISVVADFGGDTAGEISFERRCVSGDTAPSGEERERSSGDIETGFNPAIARTLTARADGSPCTDSGPNIVCSPHQGGCDGGGKGALVQTEKSGTLGCGNDQTIFCMATQQGGSEVRSDDRAHTLTAAAGMSGNNQPVICLQGNGIDRADTAGCNGKGWREDVSYTLNTIDRPAVMCAGFKLGNSEQAHSIGYAEEQAPTLNAECGGNKPAVVAFDMTHACDVIRDCGEIVPSLQARMGTGGNQVPLTYQTVTGTLSPGAHAGSYNGQDAYNDMLVVSSDISPALRSKANDPHRTDMAAYVASVDCRNFTEGGETNGTLQAKESGGQSLNLNNTVRQNMVVRRLTPLECERLQGYPDKWTDIGEWRDSKGKLHKPSDSPRYKACGNSIALPFWDFLAKRISAQYIRPITLGSLFDGIGGFPLVFERHNGKGSARWASEVEEFPIAVTKLWFGEG